MSNPCTFLRHFAFAAALILAAPIAIMAQTPNKPQSLDTVRVTAPEDPVRKSYFIDAKEIAATQRFLGDALDVVLKLRPDMAWGRVGRPDQIDLLGYRSVILPNNRVGQGAATAAPSAAALAAQGAKFGYCPPVQNLWVNGEWVRDITIKSDAAMRIARNVAVNSTIATALASIRPEHVAEIEYRPCNAVATDSTAHARNAIYVRLKAGIRFDPGIGSTSGPVIVTASANRLLGVFDDVTGDVLPDVEVVDVSTGTVARTTKTGTVGLGFLGAGQREIRVQKRGFTAQTLKVDVAADSAPITLVLAHAPR